VTAHELRHTCAHDLIPDPALSLTDVKTVLRHGRISSTERYLISRVDEVIDSVQCHCRHPHVTEARRSTSGSWTYREDDLTDLPRSRSRGLRLRPGGFSEPIRVTTLSVRIAVTAVGLEIDPNPDETTAAAAAGSAL
jgi:hypothetical protein